jgi:hypothetical protein
MIVDISECTLTHKSTWSAVAVKKEQHHWRWGRKVQLSRKYDNLLLAKYVDGPTAWHVTAWCGYKDTKTF